MLIGKTVSPEEMMACRENRAALQAAYRQQFQRPVISFCMNIPGPIKTTRKIRQAFEVGCQEIEAALAATHGQIFASTLIYERTGDEWLLCVDGDASAIKRLMASIEERHPLGRLFDIDVLDAQGDKLSRAGYRACFICQEQAQLCARSRKHSVAEMQDKIEAMLDAFFA